MNYLLWSARTEPGHCVLGGTYIEKVGRLHAGEAVPPDFGQPIEYGMNDLFPDDIELSDNYEISGQVIISRKFRDALQKMVRDPELQFLPVTIRNHKGKVASKDYFILHPHRVCDCIDLKKSKVEWNPVNKKKIYRCQALILKPSAIPKEWQLFRLKHWGLCIMASEAVAKALLSQKWVGLHFVDPATYDGV